MAVEGALAEDSSCSKVLGCSGAPGPPTWGFRHKRKDEGGCGRRCFRRETLSAGKGWQAGRATRRECQCSHLWTLVALSKSRSSKTDLLCDTPSESWMCVQQGCVYVWWEGPANPADPAGCCTPLAFAHIVYLHSTHTHTQAHEL